MLKSTKISTSILAIAVVLDGTRFALAIADDNGSFGPTTHELVAATAGDGLAVKMFQRECDRGVHMWLSEVGTNL